MKNKKNISLILTMLFSLVGCGNDNSSSSHSVNSQNPIISSSQSSSSIIEESIVDIDVKIFLEQVTLLNDETITLDHKCQIDGVYYIYSSLTPEMKELPEVIEAKEKLDEIKEKYLELYEEYISNKEREETIVAFNDLVDSLGDIDSLIREDKKNIDKLLSLYNTFSNEIKNSSEIKESKEKLDAYNERINELMNMSDEEYAVILFISMVSKLPNIDELTTFDIEVVQEAIQAYEKLDDAVKERQDVLEAKEKLDELNQRVEHLLIVKEHANAFVSLVSDLPTFSELEWNNQNQNNAITAAENAYLALTEEEKQVTSVITAYSELQAIRTTFDGLKEPYDINKLSFAISLDWPQGSQNRSAAFSYTPGKDHITVLTNYYNIPKDELSKYVAVYLNIYIEAGAVPSQPLYSYDITEDYSGYDSNKYVETLKELKSGGNDKVKSGIGYNFTINIVSLNDDYASSKYSSFTQGIVFTF